MASLWGELFGEDRFQNRYLNKALQAQIDKSATEMPAWFRGIGMKSVGDLTAANPALQAKQAADTQALLANIKQASARASGFDAQAAANLWSDSQLARAKSWLKTATGADSAAGKLARARLGYAGRPDSSYSQFLRTNEMAGQMNPMVAQLLANAGVDASRFGMANNASIGAVLQALGAVPGTYEALADAYLRPAQAAQGVAATDANLLTMLGNAAKTNFLGLENKRKHGIGDYLEQVWKSLADQTGNQATAVGNVMGMIGNVYSMGALGATGKAGAPTDASRGQQFMAARQPINQGMGIGYDLPQYGGGYGGFNGYGGGIETRPAIGQGMGMGYDLPEKESGGGAGALGGILGMFGKGGGMGFGG